MLTEAYHGDAWDAFETVLGPLERAYLRDHIRTARGFAAAHLNAAARVRLNSTDPIIHRVHIAAARQLREKA